MQSLFATQNPSQQVNQSKVGNENQEGEFNTMQSLFKTQNMQYMPQQIQ